MNKFAVAAILPLFAGCVWAQSQQKIQTTWNGTLVDSGCSSSKTERQGDVYVATPFALITGDGRCIPFDLESNEKVSGMLKVKANWSKNVVKIKPTKVQIVGTENDGTISVDEIAFMSR